MREALLDTIADIMRSAAQDALTGLDDSPWTSGGERILSAVEDALDAQLTKTLREGLVDAFRAAWSAPAQEPERECSECEATLWNWDEGESDLCDECTPDEYGIRARDCDCSDAFDGVPDICHAHRNAIRRATPRWTHPLWPTSDLPSWPL